MPMWLEIIAANAVLGLACFARGAYLELKKTREQLENAKEIIRYLEAELSQYQ